MLLTARAKACSFVPRRLVGGARDRATSRREIRLVRVIAMTAPHKVSCHCGNIQLEVSAELSEVFECNCSICSRTGFLHWYVPPEAVRLVTEKRQLSTYAWR